MRRVEAWEGCEVQDLKCRRQQVDSGVLIHEWRLTAEDLKQDLIREPIPAALRLSGRGHDAGCRGARRTRKMARQTRTRADKRNESWLDDKGGRQTRLIDDLRAEVRVFLGACWA